MKKKIMVSQPMNGFTEEQITETRNRFLQFAEDNDFKVINSYFQSDWCSRSSMDAKGVVQIPLAFLSKAIESMSLCHAVYFAKGWENARGCKIEHKIASDYGLEIIYE